MGQAARERKEKEISRRKFNSIIKNSLIGAGVLSVGGYVAYESLRAPTFQEAFLDERLREAWANSLSSRPYSTLHIATPEVLAKLKQQRHYVPPKGAFAAAYPRDKTKLCNGTTSDVYVFPNECFSKRHEKRIEGLGIVVENTIQNHELVHTDHFFSGIPGYPLELFKNSDGSMNYGLFNSVGEIFGYRSEYEGLKKHLGKNDFVDFYHKKIRQMAGPYLSLALAYCKNPSLAARIQKEAQF